MVGTISLADWVNVPMPVIPVYAWVPPSCWSVPAERSVTKHVVGLTSRSGALVKRALAVIVPRESSIIPGSFPGPLMRIVPASVKAPVAITPKTWEVLEASMNESVSDLGGVDAVASAVRARAAAAATAAAVPAISLCAWLSPFVADLPARGGGVLGGARWRIVTGRSSMAALTAAVVGRG